LSAIADFLVHFMVKFFHLLRPVLHLWKSTI